jgi:hypothetical protein
MIILAGAAVPAAARAQVTEDQFLVRDTADLVALCAAQPADRMFTAAQNFCHGFMVGLYRALQAEQTSRAAPLFCPPAQTPTRSDAVASFVRWAQVSPARLRLSAADGVATFLVERLPCKPGG